MPQSSPVSSSCNVIITETRSFIWTLLKPVSHKQLIFMVYFSIICTKNKSYVEAMCFCPCFVRLFSYLNVLLQWLQRKVFSSLWDLVWLCKNYGRICHTCMAFLQCAHSSCWSSIGWLWCLKSHTVNICEAFPQSGSSCVASYVPIELKNIHTDCIGEASPQCGSWCVSSDE